MEGPIQPRNVAGTAARPPAGPAQPAADLRLDSGIWFRGARRVIEIDHHGTIYRLRCTAQGKLILTK